MKRKYLPCLLILLFGALLCEAGHKDAHLRTRLRRIGHEFLMQMEDSTSRVLPIKKEAGRYKIAFEKEFGFEPAMLSLAVSRVLGQSSFGHYLVEVESCGSSEVVYSYATGTMTDEAQLHCQSRTLPKDCYAVFLTLPDTEITGQAQKAGSPSHLAPIYWIGCFVVGLSLALYLIKKKRAVPPDPDVIHIGQYTFDPKAMLLTLNAKTVPLSGKEAELLFLLFSNENKTLERDFILAAVWGNAGDYVGRTLDVFISKLRKKLEADPSLKIINIRGVGYRFVIKGE